MTTEVETSHGRLRGTEISGIRVFRGARFAAPLSGARRFLPPEPPQAWTGTREALRPGPSAPQRSLPWFAWISNAGRAPGDDCLSLNLWTPGLDGARRPVLVWIHGGGFLVGSGATPIYDGSDLARRGDVVVVTLNYRLGALGFTQWSQLFGAGFEQSSNLGLRDQIAALSWVRENIERFGGDPNDVTLFGQSAGAMSISALLGAPRARPLFRRAILQSAAGHRVLEPEVAQRVASALVAALGGPAASLPALARIPTERILRAQLEVMARHTSIRGPLMVFRPAVDGDLIPEQPIDAIAGGAVREIPLLIGATLEEWKLFRLFDVGLRTLSGRALKDRFAEVVPANYPSAPPPELALQEFREALGSRSAGGSPGEVWSAFQSARIFHYPASRIAQVQADAGGSAHFYLFTWRSPTMGRTLGACHALDIPFVFGSTQHPLARPLTGLGDGARRLSRKMQHAWLAFARGSTPEHERLPPWPAYRRDHRAALVFGRRCRIDEAPLEPERRLLERWSGETEAALPTAAAAGFGR